MNKSLECAKTLFVKVYHQDPNNINVLNRFLNLISQLSEKEEAVLIARYGIEDGQLKTVKEVSYYYGVSESTIRKVESMAIKKLRHPSKEKSIYG